jgi:hypothetical protein
MKVTITKESCRGCPMIWDCTIDGELGYIKYRWSIISLKFITERAGIFQDAEIQEQIGSDDGLDGVLELSTAINWLETYGYEVVNLIE